MFNRRNCRQLGMLGALWALVMASHSADLVISVDARHVDERRVHTEQTLKVRPGRLTLGYPEWIPGEHGATGPLETMIGLRISAGGQPLAWQRDPIDNFSLTVDVPPKVSELQISIDSGLPVSDGDFSAGPTSTPALAVISWNQFMLLPKGRDADSIVASANLSVPIGWRAASGLAATMQVQADGAPRFEFEPISAMRLIDSPVQIGRYVSTVELAGSAPAPALKHQIAIAADSPAALALPADFSQLYGQLVAEAGALFGSRMYRHYTWLLTLSDHVASFGLEHHESSDDRVGERWLLEPGSRMLLSDLLSHEYVHSWNGKYRRPSGLLSPDYLQPMDDTLLWSYEGMTQFWGDVLTARSGLIDAQQFRDLLAEVVGDFDVAPGLGWRPMADTARAAQRLYEAPDAWSSSRRGVDFYDASVLLWLDVDLRLRAASNGRASLDDYVGRFYAGTNGVPIVKAYVEQDIYDTLAQVAPADWRGIVHHHLDDLGSGAIQSTLQRAGWSLAYSADKNVWSEAREKAHKLTDRRWSIGLVIDEKHVIVDAIAGRAAAQAGISPGVTLLAVNGRKYSTERLDEAIAAAQRDKAPIELLAEGAEFYRSYAVSYFDGPRYPHLARVEGTADMLGALIAPRRRLAAGGKF